MAIYHRDIKQLSPEWFIRKIGKPSAGSFDRIVTPKTGKMSAQADAYMNSLLAQWMLGEDDTENPYENEAMAQGKALEPRAVAAFEFQTGLECQKIGFVTTDDGMIGASPDSSST